ncbi:MAG TPA: heavy metal-responsive transcriptional regulator [Longimicrobiales bacterium]|nr:heavy metal-responsive transcriptional regulator [Longimicrobiales bacterium]
MPLTIGKLAASSGMTVQTVRFYEREGLLEVPARNSSGYRNYEESAAERLHFIKRAQELGFTLKEIRDLIELQVGGTADCGQVRDAAEAKLAMVEAKLADLNSMKCELERLIGSCSGNGPVQTCKIISCLSKD